MQGDYISGIALQSGVPLQKLLLDNLEALKDLDAPLPGKRLVVCIKKVSDTASALPPVSAPKPLSLAPPPAATPAPAAAPKQQGPAMSQLQALLGIRAAIDKTGALASSWTAEKGANAGFCNNFAGVTCDGAKNVANITVNELTKLNGKAGIKLGGTLPSAGSLKALPKLKTFDVSNVSLTGPLPPGWGALAQLEDIRLYSNNITGPLPKEWSGLTRLKVLHL